MLDDDFPMVSKYEEFIRTRITELRKEMGLSKIELSYSINQSKNYLSNVENGVSAPSMRSWLCLCECLEVTPKQFFATSEPDEEFPPLVREMLDSFSSLREDDQLDLIRIVKKFGKSK